MPKMGDIVRNKNSSDDFLEFISYNEAIHLQEVTTLLGSFVENGFLKQLFDKGPQAMDKAQLLVDMFGDCANPTNFSEQSKATNISPNDMGDFTDSEASDNDDLFDTTSPSYSKSTPNPVIETPPILPDVEMTPVDQTVTPETSWKKDKQKAYVTDDKQVKNQSTTANPGAQTLAKKSRKRMNISVPEATQILTGFKEADDQ